MSAPLQGLNRAFGNYEDDDPLGIGVRQRSVQEEQDALQDIPFGSDPFGIQHSDGVRNLMNAHSDPQGFVTMLQAMKEAAPGGIAMPSKRGDPLAGLKTARLGQPATYDPASQGTAVDYGRSR